MDFSVSIVIFSVETSLCKGHVFRLNIAECRITVFFSTIFKSGRSTISQKLNNGYCKICVIPVIDHCRIMLTIKLFPALSKGKLILIHTCLFRNHHKCYTSSFDHHTPHIKFFIHTIGVHVCSPSEKVSCDSFRLWKSLPLHPLQNGSNFFL